MRRQRLRSVITIIVLSLCGMASAQEIVTLNRRIMVKDPLPLVPLPRGEGVIFPAAFGQYFTSQCSRSTLGTGDSYWVPETSDVEKAEKIFQAYSRRNRPKAERLERWPDLRGYRRQYIGVVRGEKKTLYANFLPAFENLGEDWRQRPLQLCDGGPSYFGVETDLQESLIVHIDFDGCMCAVVPER
jgi:hypothetical protein